MLTFLAWSIYFGIVYSTSKALYREVEERKDEPIEGWQRYFFATLSLIVSAVIGPWIIASRLSKKILGE